VTNATGLNLDPDLAGTRLWNLAFDDLEIGSGLGNLRYFHRGYGDRCHMSSQSV
jgi:hypothetical protein